MFRGVGAPSDSPGRPTLAPPVLRQAPLVRKAVSVLGADWLGDRVQRRESWPRHMRRAKYERHPLGAVVRAHPVVLAEVAAEVGLSEQGHKVLDRFLTCRTAARGGHRLVCTNCSQVHYLLHACGDRHCPNCSVLDQLKWREQTLRKVLPISHEHGVFTVPAELRPIALAAPRFFYGMLFAAVSSVIAVRGREVLGPKTVLGSALVLHTWNRKQEFHPHVHALISVGGLGPDGTWRTAGSASARPKKGCEHPERLMPGAVLGRRLRDRVAVLLGRGVAKGKLAWRPEWGQLEALLDSLPPRFECYAKPPLGDPERALTYLSKYTSQMGLSPNAILHASEDGVVLHVKRRWGQRRAGRLRISLREFFRRVMLHILPFRFRRIRYTGLYSARSKHREAALSAITEAGLARELPAAPPTTAALLEANGLDVDLCPACGRRGTLVAKPLTDRTEHPSRRAFWQALRGLT